MRLYCLIGWVLSLNILFSTHSLSQDQFPHVKGDVLIRIKDNHSINWLVEDFALYKGLRTQLKVKALLSEHMNIWHLHFNPDMITNHRMLELVRSHPSVINAQLNFILEKRVTPNDPSYNQQWQYEQASDFDLDASAAWDITTGGITALGDTIVVCVIDDALEVSHPDISNNVWRNRGEIMGNGIDDDGNGYIDDFQGWNANNNNNNILPGGSFDDHGTPVAGIIAAQGNNGIGVSGVNWNIKLMFVVGGGTSANSIAAYNYPFQCRKLYNQSNGASGAFVVATNASWGQDNQQCATYAPLVNQFYDTLGAYGILNAAATANANNNVDATGDFPTSCDSDYLIAVTNIDQSGSKVQQAGYGATSIDLGAYGAGTYTIAINNSYNSFGGTSGATPHVAGLIGLLYSAPCPRLALWARTQPAQTALMLKQIILNSTVPNGSLSNITVTSGVLNMKNALDSVMNISCSLSGCQPPHSLVSSNITGSGATFSWTTIDSTNLYYIQYRMANTPNWTTTSTTDTFIHLNNLTHCTTYELKVASDCDSSAYSSIETFKTGNCCLPPTTITIDHQGTNNASFSWAGDSLVNSYTVEYKLKSDSTWTTTTTTTSPIALSGLDSCSTYELRIIASCAVNLNNMYSPTIEFRTQGCGKCTSGNYCASSGQNSSNDWIEKVSLGSIHHSTGNNNGYGSFVNAGPSTNLAQGGTYPISLEIGFNSGQWGSNWRLKAWIDYNQDEQFDDSTELAYDVGTINNPIPQHNGTITIPVNAALGSTRMRVAMKWGGNLGACDNSSYGETEDYCINIISPTSVHPIKSTEKTQLIVYPNPFQQQLTIELESPVQQTSTIVLQTITGQEIINITKNLNLGNNRIQLPSNKLPKGVYLISTHLENGQVLTQKVVRQ